MGQEIGFHEKLVDFFCVIAQLDGLYREVNRVRWLASSSLLGVVGFMVHAEEASTSVEERETDVPQLPPLVHASCALAKPTAPSLHLFLYLPRVSKIT